MITRAAEIAGVTRQSVAAWVKLGLLVGKPTRVGNITATLVSVAEVRKLAKSRKPGRPRKGK